MNIDELRSFAHEGSTHVYIWWSDLFEEDCYDFIKIENDIIFDMLRGKWVETSQYNIDDLIPIY